MKMFQVFDSERGWQDKFDLITEEDILHAKWFQTKLPDYFRIVDDCHAIGFRSAKEADQLHESMDKEGYPFLMIIPIREMSYTEKGLIERLTR